MLRFLDIRDLLIIDHLELEFQPGLNVLTGETGAGKSILLDALGFVLGWRGRAELVRQGAAQGEVTAVFDVPEAHPARAILREGAYGDVEELILRRVNTADGRKTAWVNGRRVSGDVLRALSDVLVELHGQHDDRGLLDTKGHLALLDAFAGSASEQKAVRDAWQALATARRDDTRAKEVLNAARAEEDFLRHAVAEFDTLVPEPGEDAALDARRRLMQAAERIRDDIVKAHAAMGYDGAEGSMVNALRWLEGVVDSAEGRLDAPVAALGRAMNELAEAEQGVADCLDAMAFDPTELETVEERLFAIRALARKHGVLPDDLATFAEDLRSRLRAIDHGASDLDALGAAVRAAQTRYDAAAGALRDKRRAAASRLDLAMAGELAPLKMERAVFQTELATVSAGPGGIDGAAFTVATNPGAPAGPLNKIASGGELSRFLLALKMCLTQDTPDQTMIFDEIDRGVGGATADAVGRRLAALADKAQVLVVTHSPQVAAQGAHHWQVLKDVVDQTTLSTVRPLSPDARVDEIARMLSGDRVTDEARGAARALLNG